jgi:hypothetical protein
MILAIDPGVTTGFANEEEAYQIRFDNYPDPHIQLLNHLAKVMPDQVIYEPFHWRQGQLNAIFTGVEYIGVIQLWCQAHARPVHLVNPSDGKGFWDNKKLQTLDLWIAGCAHGMDARRILLTWKTKQDPEYRKYLLGRLRASSR